MVMYISNLHLTHFGQKFTYDSFAFTRRYILSDKLFYLEIEHHVTELQQDFLR